MYTVVHLLLLLLTSALLTLTFMQYRDFTRKTGRIVFVLILDSNVIGIYRSIELLKKSAEQKYLADKQLHWERGSLYRYHLNTWMYTGYSYEALPVQGSWEE